MLSPEATLVKLVNKSHYESTEFFEELFFQSWNRLPKPVSRKQALLSAQSDLRFSEESEARTALMSVVAYCLLQLCEQF